ncbi:hypothetical protein ACFLVY_00035 [Chloroflexota bacterium]
MEAKFQKKQKVRFILAKNQHLYSKYPQFERYVGETGVVIDTYWIGGSQPYDVGVEAPVISSYYYYTLHLDKDDSEVTAVPEDALDVA